MNPFSKRVTKHDAPPAINPITQRPYNAAAPQRDEQAERELAAGQLALATAKVPTPPAVGFDPRRSAWGGCD